MIEHCPEDFATGGNFVQSPEQMREESALRTAHCNAVLERMLDALIQ